MGSGGLCEYAGCLLVFLWLSPRLLVCQPGSGEFYTKTGTFPIFCKDIRMFIFLLGSYLNPIFILG